MYTKAWQAIENANSIVLVSHKNPDGDTLGSVLALYEALRKKGKSVTLYNPSPKMLNKFHFLPNIKKMKNGLEDKIFELIITCDCGSLNRALIDAKRNNLINIDHHQTNENFGDINVVDASFPSTTMVVYKLLQENRVQITKNIALCLYVGFVEDTGFFTYGNIQASHLEAISHFVKAGIDLGEIGTLLKQNSSLAYIRLKQFILNNFCLQENATIGTVIITQKDLLHIGCKESDTKNILHLILELATVKVAIMVIEREFNEAKISLRSKGDIDVSSIALTFGGGGHKNAAGFEIKSFEPENILKQIVEKLKLGKMNEAKKK